MKAWFWKARQEPLLHHTQKRLPRKLCWFWVRDCTIRATLLKFTRYDGKQQGNLKILTSFHSCLFEHRPRAVAPSQFGTYFFQNVQCCWDISNIYCVPNKCCINVLDVLYFELLLRCDFRLTLWHQWVKKIVLSCTSICRKRLSTATRVSARVPAQQMGIAFFVSESKMKKRRKDI